MQVKCQIPSCSYDQPIHVYTLFISHLVKSINLIQISLRSTHNNLMIIDPPLPFLLTPSEVCFLGLHFLPLQHLVNILHHLCLLLLGFGLLPRLLLCLGHPLLPAGCHSLLRRLLLLLLLLSYFHLLGLKLSKHAKSMTHPSSDSNRQR